MNLKVYTILTVIVLSGVVLAGCSSQPSSSTEKTTPSESSSTTKVGDTVVTGSISKVGTKYYVTQPDGKKQELDSYAVDLEAYVGKSVKITGQFSGDTLFAGKVE